MQPEPQDQPRTRNWRYWMRFGLVGGGLVLVLAFMYALADIFTPLLIALALAYILNPVVVWLENRGWSRKAAIIWIYAAMAVVLIAGVVLFVPLVAREVGTWAVAVVGEDATTVLDVADKPVQRPPAKLQPGEFIDEAVGGIKNGKHDPNEIARLTYRDEELRPGRADHIARRHYIDANGNKKYDQGEEANREIHWSKLIPDDKGDLAPGTFKDQNGNRQWDNGEPSNPRYDDEQLIPGRKRPSPGRYIDSNGNGRYDPGYLDRIHRNASDPTTRLGGIVHHLEQFSHDTETQKLVRVQIYDYFRSRAGEIVKSTSRITREGLAAIGEGLSGAVALIISAILIPFYLFFFLLDLGGIRTVAYAYIPMDYREQAIHILERIHEANAAFFRGRLIVCSIMGLAAVIGLVAFGGRFGVLFGILMGIASFIPFLSIIPMIPVTVIGLMDHGLLMTLVIWLVVYGGIQGIEAAVTPKIMGDKLGQHPITIVVSLFIFGKLMGFLGMLLAIPITAALKILGEELVLPVLKQVAEPDDHPDLNEELDASPVNASEKEQETAEPPAPEPPAPEPEDLPKATPKPAKKKKKKAKSKKTKRTKRKKKS